MMNTSPCVNKPWLTHYEPGVPDCIDYDRICLPEILDATADSYPDKAALSFQGYQITYRDLKQMVDRFAVCLNEFGVKRGDRVAILLPNLIPCVAVYFAIFITDCLYQSCINFFSGDFCIEGVVCRLNATRSSAQEDENHSHV